MELSNEIEAAEQAALEAAKTNDPVVGMNWRCKSLFSFLIHHKYRKNKEQF